VFPNATRAAWATDDTGFQLANVSSGPGNASARTNAFDRGVAPSARAGSTTGRGKRPAIDG
jgi:hypothetical protein